MLQTRLNTVPAGAQASGAVQRQFVVMGEILARYGIGLNDQANRATNGSANLETNRDISSGYLRIDNTTNGGVPVQGSRITARSGQTLQQMAYQVYGDASQWWKIALVNPGLGVTGATGIAGGMHSKGSLAGSHVAGPDSVLAEGQSIFIPSAVGGIHNNATETRSLYDPSKVVGDTRGAPSKPHCGAQPRSLEHMAALDF